MTDPFQRIIDRAAAGEYMNPATLAMSKAEEAQRERMIARFANRPKTPATADFDLPAASNHD